MKHLIPSLQDDQKAADSLRQVRWPAGGTCPRCGSDAVESRERYDNGLQRFSWVPCAVRLGQQFAMFTDLDQLDLRREQVAAPRMVAGDGLVAVEAERHRPCCSC
jgi:hypothetical protein